MARVVPQRVPFLNGGGRAGTAVGDHPGQVVTACGGAENDPAALAVAEQPDRVGSHSWLRTQEVQRGYGIGGQVVERGVAPVA
jgi:hypothetical protein